MPQDFYPFVENGEAGASDGRADSIRVEHPARVAVYDDASAAPRVVIIEPQDVRSYLEEITATVTRLAREQGGTIPFMVIREIVENFIHAYFQAPTISILDNGNTIRFSDQGPGIREKGLALEFGTSSATEEMKRYIRGVGSGLPYVQQYMEDKGGSLEVEDNIAGGTVITLSTRPADEARGISGAEPAAAQEAPAAVAAPTPTWQGMPPQTYWAPTQQAWPATAPYPWPATVPQQTYATAQAAPQMPAVELDERSSNAISFIAERGSAGPSDLTRAFGSSGPTWSRVLSNLAAQGIVTKVGQKYQLTGIGRALV